MDWLCQLRATALTITRRLWLEIVGPVPSITRLEGIAAAWRVKNLALPWLITTLETSPEAVAASNSATRLASPIAVMSRSLALLGGRHPVSLHIELQHLPRMGQARFEPPSVKGWPVNEGWLNLRWLQALLSDSEVCASNRLPDRLDADLTAIPPLTLRLPAEATRESLARLWSDPVWQLR